MNSKRAHGRYCEFLFEEIHSNDYFFEKIKRMLQKYTRKINLKIYSDML